MNKTYLIYGNGGHGRVVEDLILQLEPSAEITFFDSKEKLYSKEINIDALIIVAIGNNNKREEVVKSVSHSFATLIHPKAYVSPSAVIGEGTVILANAVVQANAIIGKHCIINANVTIDHDAILGDYVCTYPGVYVGGGVNIVGSMTLNPGQIEKK